VGTVFVARSQGKAVSAHSSRIDATLAGQLPAAAALGLLATLLLIGP